MNEKSLIIIGAGLAGLSAGCYGRMNGYRVTVFEQDARPGGLCTAWERQGYTINGGLAMLAGSGPAVGFNHTWQELGVIPQIRMIDYEQLIQVEGADGKTLEYYTDIDRLEKHLLELAPEDNKAIKAFIRGARTFSKYSLPLDKASELLTGIDKLKLMFTHFPMLLAMTRWKKTSVVRFVKSLKNPFLREAFYQAKALFSDDFPMAAWQMFLAWSHLKSAGFPAGGALEFVQAIERRFLDLGGEIHYNERVEKILVENGKATGVRLADGKNHRADFVISAADGRSTIFDMLEGKFLDEKIRLLYKRLPVGPTVIMVALGVNRLFNDLPHCAFGTVFKLKEPVTIAGVNMSWLRPMVYNFDPSLSPAGKTLVRVVLPADYDYWKSQGWNTLRYRAEKEKAAEMVIALLEQRFPGILRQVEMRDVATPLTFERYTGNWRGSIFGWDGTTKTFLSPLPKQLPGLKNFYMAGHWTDGGAGVPGSALSGRAAIEHICRQEKRTFSASIPTQ